MPLFEHSKMPLFEQSITHKTYKPESSIMGRENIVSMSIDQPTTINLVPKCGNHAIEKFSPETCSNMCNTLNSKLTTTNVVLLLVILLFMYYIFIMHRNPVKDIMSL
jgi:hypothetical protein